jgi:hypothetical protein
MSAKGRIPNKVKAILQLTAEIQEKFGNPLLSVELVPSSCWYSNVRDHVNTEEWDTLRRWAYQQSGHLCAVCGGRGPKWPVECHEIWQYDDRNSIQKLVGLTALCPSCHQVKHIGRAGLYNQGEEAKAHLTKINGWTTEQTKTYLSLVWAIWKARSAQKKWTLDMTWLEPFGMHIQPKR